MNSGKFKDFNFHSGGQFLDGSKISIAQQFKESGSNRDIKQIALNLSEVIAHQQKELKSLNDRISDLERSKKKK